MFADVVFGFFLLMIVMGSLIVKYQDPLRVKVEEFRNK